MKLLINHIWYINLGGLFNGKTILVEKQYYYYLIHGWEDNGVLTFLKGISPKLNVIAWLQFERTYFEMSVQYFSHDAMGNSPICN